MNEAHGFIATSTGVPGLIDKAFARPSWRVARLIQRVFGTSPNRQARIAVYGSVALLPVIWAGGDRLLFGVYVALLPMTIRRRLADLRRIADIEARLPDMTVADLQAVYAMRFNRLLGVGVLTLSVVLGVTPTVNPRSVVFGLLWWWTLTWPLYAALWFGPPKARLRDHVKAGARRLAELARAIAPKAGADPVARLMAWSSKRRPQVPSAPTPAKVRCQACGAIFDRIPRDTDKRVRCSTCGSTRLRVT